MEHHYFLVGIAGAGMSGIGHILLDRGHLVSGSDLTENHATRALSARGATCFVGHTPAHIAAATQRHPIHTVITTAAAKPDHPELQAAHAAGIPVIKRDHVWREWSAARPIIAVAGTHGKTTTTAMIALILERAGLQPGFFIGSQPLDLDTSATWGDPSAPMVVEADEYDFAFHWLTPHITVITTIEWDHPDIYLTPVAYETAFVRIAQQTMRPLGTRAPTVLVCGDQNVPRVVRRVDILDSTAYFTYGLNPTNYYSPDLLAQRLGSNAAHILRTQLQTPGEHTISNALAALAVADRLGLSVAESLMTLTTFRGTARRFEYKGEIGGVLVVDDYAHHPTEVRTTLRAARSRYPHRRIVAYVQPHTYTRTCTLFTDWLDAFVDADVVLVGDIYPAREPPPPDLATSLLTPKQALALALRNHIAQQHPRVYYAGNTRAATAILSDIIQAGDLFITLGAGDGDQIGETLLKDIRG